MTLQQLAKDLTYTGTLTDAQVTGITADSRQVEPGSVFVCIAGGKFDGHDHAASALEKGAVLVVAQRDLGLSPQILVEDTREAYGLLCGAFFDYPAKKLKLIGVTGTNGKTTITYLVKQILEAAGKKVGLLGTIHNEIADMVIPSKHTTPDPLQLHAMFARMAEAGCEYAVMEVSSHALDQRRVAGCRFDCGIFTNLTQDHLDYHGSMESYYLAKKKLFELSDRAVINLDDPTGQKLISELSCPVTSFSCQRDDADYTARDIRFSAKGSQFSLLANSQLARVSFAMPGEFSVSNALAAAVGCISVGLTFEQAVAGLNQCKGVPGRIEILPTDTPFTIIRDYAHSPDGLEKIITAVRVFAPGRVVTLFGCAGNRDRTKRPIMGEIVSRLSDFCILTSDNPRDENPQRVVDDVLPGLLEHDTPHEVIVDRYSAIEWALDNCHEGDILILAGKGHEDYQVLDYGTIFFDEKVIVDELLAKKKGEAKR
ncbi:UDP-N-acetylmuramoyl-L-alanyl-D-glutamate--2,6-diaminopimelate ligase [Oscillospiraceae bacterium MB08-C2-2]|nr:UDP-N-acetylmuramoyl-L-alanyl-D-glutamate--2,6-diaminopimelate ligase [Oscillospiraceae bacterium MB08-C2-2]